MNTPIVMLVSVILWSFGISAAALVGLMFLDWLEQRRTGYGAQPAGGQARLGRIEQQRSAGVHAKAA